MPRLNECFCIIHVVIILYYNFYVNYPHYRLPTYNRHL